MLGFLSPFLVRSSRPYLHECKLDFFARFSIDYRPSEHSENVEKKSGGENLKRKHCTTPYLLVSIPLNNDVSFEFIETHPVSSNVPSVSKSA